MIASIAIAPEHYVSEDTFKQELEHVFKKQWLFIGFRDELANHNDFLTLDIAGFPIVVQNFDGELSALLNICSHRKARLQTAPKGNRPLRCPYHCWSYKAGGRLAGIPANNQEFQLDESQKAALGLKQFAVDTCGNFVFVRVSQDGPSLRAFLGDCFGMLEDFSAHFNDPVHSGRYVWKSNWKLAVETVLEVYHVPGTHPDSFSNLARAECDIISIAPHNLGNTPLLEAPKKWWAGVRKQLKLNQHPTLDEYNHVFIYPNLAIGLTNGSLMSVQTYDPLNREETVLHYRLRMVSTPDGPAREGALKRAVVANFTEFNHTILEEDRIMAESCQLNYAHTATPALLGKCEDRIRLFHDAWRTDNDRANSEGAK
ncbi:aromatic ring-hydroxylating dioxygenase subunit alpha [Shewanella sp. FJAT-52076]|uniref:aromatic ring-hydroxylating oxygenase subunit alpha n=1 Tax=Shewanella sp. FJAT-52076 TaxID=2864202 RepID=UPI001C65D088|nr:aromatic ring-hydroxylating dioxygenase subunit alpha [Shewanella sp. FJAT-52076]QYJ74125.1 aromatic ring-hydroxylating dioxygenase subunit alpha [Shewanella sp. FJAT-52076]